MNPVLQLILASFGIGLLCASILWSFARAELLKCDLIAILDRLDRAPHEWNENAHIAYQHYNVTLKFLIAAADVLSPSSLLVSCFGRRSSLGQSDDETRRHFEPYDPEKSMAFFKATLEIMAPSQGMPPEILRARNELGAVLIIYYATSLSTWLVAALLTLTGYWKTFLQRLAARMQTFATSESLAMNESLTA